MKNTIHEYTFHTNSPEETSMLGETIGLSLHGGEIIELSSDVGGGKTTFTKGIVKGIGNDDVVTSPTFTVAKEYRGRTLQLFHYDFYRLHEPGVVGQELQEVLQDNYHVVVIEWSAIAEPLFVDKPVIRISLKGDATNQRLRHVTVAVPDAYDDLREKLKGLE